MSEQKRRRFSREFKLRVIERLEAGESGTALGLELSIKRTIIYRWRDRWRQGGTVGVAWQAGASNQGRGVGAGTGARDSGAGERSDRGAG